MELFIISNDEVLEMSYFTIEGESGDSEIPFNRIVNTTGNKFITLDSEIPFNRIVNTTGNKFITLNKKITNWELYKEGDINWLL